MYGSKIMIVDDEAGIRELMSEALSEKGFDVTSAKDGRETLMHLNKNSFDLLITDISMPCLDGIELLKKMKKEGRREKVIIMTGSYVDCSEIKDIPFIYSQLIKPFRMNELVRVVTSVLKSKTRSHGKRKINNREKKCYSN